MATGWFNSRRPAAAAHHAETGLINSEREGGDREREGEKERERESINIYINVVFV